MRNQNGDPREREISGKREGLKWMDLCPDWLPLNVGFTKTYNVLLELLDSFKNRGCVRVKASICSHSRLAQSIVVGGSNLQKVGEYPHIPFGSETPCAFSNVPCQKSVGLPVI